MHRVLDAEVGHLRLMMQKLDQARPSKLEFCREPGSALGFYPQGAFRLSATSFRTTRH